MMVGSNCRTCRFYKEQVEPGMEQDFGDCRFDAPRCRFGPDYEGTTSVWPLVDGSDWCGRYAVNPQRQLKEAA